MYKFSSPQQLFWSWNLTKKVSPHNAHQGLVKVEQLSLFHMNLSQEQTKKHPPHSDQHKKHFSHQEPSKNIFVEVRSEEELDINERSTEPLPWDRERERKILENRISDIDEIKWNEAEDNPHSGIYKKAEEIIVVKKEPIRFSNETKKENVIPDSADHPSV